MESRGKKTLGKEAALLLIFIVCVCVCFIKWKRGERGNE